MSVILNHVPKIKLELIIYSATKEEVALFLYLFFLSYFNKSAT